MDRQTLTALQFKVVKLEHHLRIRPFSAGLHREHMANEFRSFRNLGPIVRLNRGLGLDDYVIADFGGL
jgi:hypothetical protein